MEPINKRTKKKAKKAAANKQPVALVAQTVPTGGYLWAKDEEELVDYEAEKPATFSFMEDDFSVVGDDTSPPTDRKHNIYSTNDNFPAYPAEGADRVGGKRSQNFQEGERSRKSNRSVCVGSPLQEKYIPTTYDSRMNFAALPTGVAGPETSL